MSAKSATLAKSLHTVSAIVAVAQHLRRTDQYFAHPQHAAAAADCALAVLGYAGAADPYGLRARAVAILQKDAL